MSTRANHHFAITNFFVRWVLALVLVLVTYNPWYSYSHWVYGTLTDSSATSMAFHAFQLLLGIMLLAAYVIYIRATLRSLGLIGAALVVALLGGMLWVVFETGLLGGQVHQGTFWVWMGLVGLATVLAVGMSWSHIHRRMTGQYSADQAG